MCGILFWVDILGIDTFLILCIAKQSRFVPSRMRAFWEDFEMYNDLNSYFYALENLKIVYEHPTADHAELNL